MTQSAWAKEMINKRSVPILLVLPALVAGYAYLYHTQEKPMEIFAIFGEQIYVKKAGESPDDGHARYTIKEETIVRDQKGRRLSFQDLAVGQRVMVREETKSFQFMVYPPMLSAREVIVIR